MPSTMAMRHSLLIVLMLGRSCIFGSRRGEARGHLHFRARVLANGL